MALTLHTEFPGANARILKVTDGPAAEIVFAASPHGGPEALWFHFSVVDPDPRDTVPETLTVTLRFVMNLLGGGGDPAYCRPVIRQQDKNWIRLRAPTVDHLPDAQPVLRWSIPYPRQRTDIAFCHPYGPDELKVLLQHCRGYWRQESIGLTQGDQVITRLDNQVMDTRGEAATRPRGLYLLARQHAGEMPGSWLLDGILEGFSRSKSGHTWCVWAVPFTHLDGVMAGDYGKDPFPYDLNRAWGSPPMRHETLVLQRDMRRWATHCRPELVLDLHAPGAFEHDGIYLFRQAEAAEPSEPDRSESAWINVLQQGLGPEYAADPFARVAAYASRWSTPRVTDFVRQHIGCTALSIETPYAVCRDIVMTPKQYREAGRRLARAILTRW